MTFFELSMFVGVLAALYVIFQPMVAARRHYSREKELVGRPVSINTTHRF